MKTKFNIPVFAWKQLGYSEDRIYLECAKEYLLKEIEQLRQEKNKWQGAAFKAKIPLYIRTIFGAKLDERAEHLSHLLRGLIGEINELKTIKNGEQHA